MSTYIKLQDLELMLDHLFANITSYENEELEEELEAEREKKLGSSKDLIKRLLKEIDDLKIILNNNQQYKIGNETGFNRAWERFKEAKNEY